MTRIVPPSLAIAGSFVLAGAGLAQQVTAGGRPAQLDIRAAGEHSVRITLKPLDFEGDFPATPVLVERPYPRPALSLRRVDRPVRHRVGNLSVEVRPAPLTVAVTDPEGRPIQTIVFEDDGTLSFRLDDQPVLGLGGGGPRPERGTNWREQPVQFDRRGAFHPMEPRWQSDMYGSRNPVPLLWGTSGWGLFVVAPWVKVDLRDPERGVFLPWIPPEGPPQHQRNQHEQLGKGTPPRDWVVPGLYDLFVFDARDPARALKDLAALTGPAAMPPRWALGYMQSHRTLRDETEMLGIIDTFRAKRIPLDAVIYLGTGFTPRGWNTRQPSFAFNPEVFLRDPREVLAEMHARSTCAPGRSSPSTRCVSTRVSRWRSRPRSGSTGARTATSRSTTTTGSARPTWRATAPGSASRGTIGRAGWWSGPTRRGAPPIWSRSAPSACCSSPTAPPPRSDTGGSRSS